MKSTNKTRYLILGLLSESPLSGYEIKKIVDLRFTYFWSESYGQIYPELNRMNEAELIQKIEDENTAGKRNRSKYAITEKGMQELRDWLAAPVEKEVIRYELLLKMYFSNLTSEDVMMDHIREFQMNHKKQQQMFTLFQESLEQCIEEHENHQDILMVLQFGQKLGNAYDEWCDEALKMLGKRKESKGK